MQFHLAHMGDIKQSGLSAGMFVFNDYACRVLHRHVIAGEPHHAGAKLPMQSIQRGLAQLCGWFFIGMGQKVCLRYPEMSISHRHKSNAETDPLCHGT